MAAKAKLAEKPKPSKSAKTKTAKTAEAKPAVTKPTPAKAAKATPKAKLKAVKSPARSKAKPAVAPEHIATPEPPVTPVQAAAEPDLDVYYVMLEPLPVHIRGDEPDAAGQAIAFSSFAEAKERVIDHLIELIEEAERRLHVLRRASNRDEYPH